MWFRIFNYVGFQAGWLACVAGPGQGLPWIGLPIVGLFLAVHLLLTSARRREAMLALLLALIGTGVESLHLALGLFQTTAGAWIGWLCPAWLTLLWVNFSPTLYGSMQWMMGRPLTASLFGAIGGPVSYYAAGQFGAISFPEDPRFSLGALAVVWGLAMPGLLRLAQWADRRWGNKAP